MEPVRWFRHGLNYDDQYDRAKGLTYWSANSSAFPSMSVTSTAQLVSSKDDALIYAHVVGDSTKSYLVFVHSFTLSAPAFDNLFTKQS
ncbi:hypothetical protein ARMSODRAFT_461065 [Armillaria solidipes]|uniref:Uncharacterized protein n=1 Tax=Armillaria solidipes TaxID=1076256 RepID=A0A2H3B1K7_9AGAR|nr:hypothetical protein ARMSODRAFT_461065 [Armillaria solidipes]